MLIGNVLQCLSVISNICILYSLLSLNHGTSIIIELFIPYVFRYLLISDAWDFMKSCPESTSVHLREEIADEDVLPKMGLHCTCNVRI